MLGALDVFLYCLFYLSYLPYQGMSIFSIKTRVEMGSAVFVFLSCLSFLSWVILMSFFIIFGDLFDVLFMIIFTILS